MRRVDESDVATYQKSLAAARAARQSIEDFVSLSSNYQDLMHAPAIQLGQGSLRKGFSLLRAQEHRSC
jgi:hypothetical protein